MDGGKLDNGQPSSPTVTPVVRQQETARLKSGKEVVLGQSYIVGDSLRIAEMGPDGHAVLSDVKDVRDQWLRKNVDPNAPLLLENSLAGTGARMIAAPMIKDQFGQAVDSAKGAMGDLFGNALQTIGGVTQQARDTIGSMFAQPAAVPSANANLNTARTEQAAQRSPTVAPTIAPVSANANRSEARSEQSSQRPTTSVIAPRSVSLAPPTQTADSVARNAISAVPKPVAPTMVSTPVTTTVRNPAYDEWVAKYGDGSQVQTAATGGMVTRDQLAAIQNVNGAVQAPIRQAPPPPPPMTITRITTRMVPANPAAPATVLKNKTTAPVGAMTPVQQLQSTGLSASQAYAALTGGPGSVAEMERKHSGGGGGGGGPAGGGEYASGGR